MPNSSRTQDYFASLQYPRDWEQQYRKKGVVSEWKNSHRGRKPLGMLGGFAQYALQQLLQDRGIQSVTWLYIASINEVSYARLMNGKRWAPASPRPLAEVEQIRQNWATMREYMGHRRFHALQAAIVKAGFTGYRGEPDLFCYDEKDRTWFFAEAKAPRDKLRDSQAKWFQVAKNTLGGNHRVRLYRVIPADKPTARTFN